MRPVARGRDCGRVTWTGRAGGGIQMWLAGCECAWAVALAAAGPEVGAHHVQEDAFRSGLLPGE